MKKTSMLSLFFVFISSPVVFATEVEELSKSDDYAQIQSLVPKIEGFATVGENDSPIANIDKSIKVYLNVDIFQKNKLIDEDVNELFESSSYYWIVPLEHTGTTTQAELDIVQPYDRTLLEENVKKGLITEKEKAELLMQEGKWDISSVEVFDEKRPFVLDYTVDFLKQNPIQVEKIWFAQPNFYFVDPMALVKGMDETYYVLVYDDIKNIDGNNEVLLEKNHLYTFEEAKEAMAKLEKDSAATALHTMGNTGPNSRKGETTGLLFVPMIVMAAGGSYWIIKRKR